MDEPRAILAKGVAYALPEGSRAILAQAVRPMPLVPAGAPVLAMFEGQGVPVLRLIADGAAWVRLPSGLLVVGDALLDARPPEALDLPDARIAAGAAPRPLPAAAEGGWAVAAGRGRARFSTLAAEIGPCRVLLPFASLLHVLPMPPVRPAPGMPRGIAGYAVAEGGPALVLDPAALMAEPVKLPAATVLVLFQIEGRAIGLPCQRIGPAAPGEVADLRAIAAAVAAFGGAPAWTTPAAPVPEPRRGLLLCSAAGLTFAVAVEEIAAVIAPIAPAPAPAPAPATPRGDVPGSRVIAHRGDVLPVLDGGLRLAGTPVLPGFGSAAPMLRLMLARPVALAVSRVTGLRQVPLSAIAAAEGSALVSGIAMLAEGAVPICRAAALAGIGASAA
jgi:chemotaxis signal transduction protein